MPSVNKTANYGLNQWQANEYPQMADFNSDNLAIDTQMKANASAAAAAQAAAPAPSSAAPAMDGTATPGNSAQYARGDHVHPTDNSRAAVSVAVSATLTAAGWAGSAAPYTQTVAVAGLGAAQNGHMQLADGTTPEQRAAARYANMTKTAQAAGSITITADGTKPTIDLPATIVLEG